MSEGESAGRARLARQRSTTKGRSTMSRRIGSQMKGHCLRVKERSGECVWLLPKEDQKDGRKERKGSASCNAC